jgi:hypothetical protein
LEVFGRLADKRYTSANPDGDGALELAAKLNLLFEEMFPIQQKRMKSINKMNSINTQIINSNTNINLINDKKLNSNVHPNVNEREIKSNDKIIRLNSTTQHGKSLVSPNKKTNKKVTIVSDK